MATSMPTGMGHRTSLHYNQVAAPSEHERYYQYGTSYGTGANYPSRVNATQPATYYPTNTSSSSYSSYTGLGNTNYAGYGNTNYTGLVNTNYTGHGSRNSSYNTHARR